MANETKYIDSISVNNETYDVIDKQSVRNVDELPATNLTRGKSISQLTDSQSFAGLKTYNGSRWLENATIICMSKSEWEAWEAKGNKLDVNEIGIMTDVTEDENDETNTSSYVVANPQTPVATTKLSTIKIGDTTYELETSSQSTNVVANPQGETSENLTSIKIDDVVYNIRGAASATLQDTYDSDNLSLTLSVI